MAAQPENTFGAPWGPVLTAISAFATLLLISSAVFGTLCAPAEVGPWFGSFFTLPLLFVSGAIPFTIRGYELQPNTLVIKRLGWQTQVPLTGLHAATADSTAMKRSMRLFGNGGMYSFTGLFRNKALGNYRAYAMETSHAVVLKINTRTVVITPDAPPAFVARLQHLYGLANSATSTSPQQPEN